MAHMTVELLLFAEVAEECGADRLSMHCAEGATVKQLIDDVGKAHPTIASRRDSIAVAVNECYVDVEHVLKDGDTVALIPPVSGG